jgi:hypothetical protein
MNASVLFQRSKSNIKSYRNNCNNRNHNKDTNKIIFSHYKIREGEELISRSIFLYYLHNPYKRSNVHSTL